MIIISRKDLFDYKNGEPPENMLTVLRALDVRALIYLQFDRVTHATQQISDPFVLRVLINQAHIERTILARTRAEADTMLKSIHGGTAWSADFFRVTVYPCVPSLSVQLSHTTC